MCHSWWGCHFFVIEAKEFIADAIVAAKRNLPTNNPAVHALTSNFCWAFPNLYQFLCTNACQSLSTRGAHPTIERSIPFLTIFNFWSWFEVQGQVKRPNIIVGVMMESLSFKHSLKDTCRFRNVSLCSLNFIQAFWFGCCKSTMAFSEDHQNFFCLNIYDFHAVHQSYHHQHHGTLVL